MRPLTPSQFELLADYATSSDTDAFGCPLASGEDDDEVDFLALVARGCLVKVPCPREDSDHGAHSVISTQGRLALRLQRVLNAA